ncbi:MAG: 2OG-Fe(II) oxygenase [Polyangiales bacterium]|nr:2OG-Fe(II) oxygenase [Myxococcales bacterium]MCB9659623.1 2OG-Fe(II) oxygenase [Sandaracinaceae bacterium]
MPGQSPVHPSVELGRHATAYAAAPAFPHIVLDHFLREDVAARAFDAFPQLGTDDWTAYTHFNEKKYGNTKLDSFPAPLREVVEHLNSPTFVAQLSALTGVPDLIPDPGLEGGGLHQSPPGGFLNVHADFTAHPHHRGWRRRVNLLLYLNPHHEPAWGGALELWDRSMQRCCATIEPVFNRAVIFNTDVDTFHGHPDPYACPPHEARRSIALYYFTAGEPVVVKSTEYRARPTDATTKRALIWADKMLLRVYDRVKRVTGIDDRLASRVLAWVDRHTRR